MTGHREEFTLLLLPLPLQVHLVHQKVGSTGNNDLAVFGILYELADTHNPALDAFW